MNPIDLVDPELREALSLWVTTPLSASALPEERAQLLKAAKAMAKPDLADISVDELRVRSAFGAEPIRVLSYRPIHSSSPLPTLMHLHGGGYVRGVPEMNDVENRLLASELGCAIYSVDYRVAPEYPYPAAVQDGLSVLEWLNKNAGALQLDPARIGVKGESAGGGLAAAISLHARDHRGPQPAFQHLIYPMLDDRTAAGTDLHPFVGNFVWTRDKNYFGWNAYLGYPPGAPDVPPYAAPARATDLSRLPPTFISVGGLDLFLEENLAYASRLSRAGVPVEFHVYPRAYHGFFRVASAQVTKQAIHDSRRALRRSLRE